MQHDTMMIEEEPASDECTICGDKYTPDTNIPLLLQCGHTFCHTCVHLVLAVTVPHNNDNTTSTTQQQQHSKNNNNCVECMICKQTTTLLGEGSSPIENRLPHNIALIAQIKAKRADPQQQPQHQIVCKICEQQDAQVFCHECANDLCPGCFERVHSSEVMKTHQCTPLADKQHHDTCLVHNQKQCVVCVECGDKPICSECVHTTCSKHTTREFASVVQDKVASVHKLHEEMQKHLQHLEELLNAAKQSIHQMAQDKEGMISNITTAMNKVREAVDRAQQELVEQACKLFDAKKKNVDCHTQHLNAIRECVAELIASKQNLPLNQSNNRTQTQHINHRSKKQKHTHEASHLAQECTSLASWVAQATNVNQQCTQLCQQSSQPTQRVILLTTAHMNTTCNDLERVLLRTKVASLLCVDPSPQSTTTSSTSTLNNSVVFGTAPRWKAAQCVATSTKSVRLVWESGLGEEQMRGERAKQVALQFRVVLKESTPHDDVRDGAEAGQGPCKAAKTVRKLCVGDEDQTITQQGKVVFEGKSTQCDVTNLAEKHHHVFELCAAYHDCTPPVRVVCADAIAVCTPFIPEWLEFESISFDGVQLTNHRRSLTNTTADYGWRFGIGKELPQNTVVKWKFRIGESTHSNLMCGIISTNTRRNCSFESESSFIWFKANRSWCRGQSTRCEGWVGWESGDEGVMTLDGVNNTLTVEHSRCVGRKFTMSITPNLSYRIQVCVCYKGECVELVAE